MKRIFAYVKYIQKSTQLMPSNFFFPTASLVQHWMRTGDCCTLDPEPVCGKVLFVNIKALLNLLPLSILFYILEESHERQSSKQPSPFALCMVTTTSHHQMNSQVTVSESYLTYRNIQYLVHIAKWQCTQYTGGLNTWWHIVIE